MFQTLIDTLSGSPMDRAEHGPLTALFRNI